MMDYSPVDLLAFSSAIPPAAWGYVCLAGLILSAAGSWSLLSVRRYRRKANPHPCRSVRLAVWLGRIGLVGYLWLAVDQAIRLLNAGLDADPSRALLWLATAIVQVAAVATSPEFDEWRKQYLIH